MLVTTAPEARWKTSLRPIARRARSPEEYAGEESAGQPEQPLPDRRDQRGRDPPLDAQDQEPLDRLEDRGRDREDAEESAQSRRAGTVGLGDDLVDEDARGDRDRQAEQGAEEGHDRRRSPARAPGP